MKYPIVIITTLVVLQGCKKIENGCPVRNFVVTSNTPVAAGDNIDLSVDDDKDVAIYNWYGPNGFTAHGQSVEIPNASGASGGIYTVDVVTRGGCIYSVSDTVQIGAVVSSCHIADQSGSLSGVTDLSFYSVQGGVNGGSYFIEANGDNGDAELEFAGTSQPVTGVYNIEPLSGDWGVGDVRVNFSAQSSSWAGGPGKVYVQVTNGKVTASFCDVEFSASAYAISTSGSLKVSE